MPQAQVKIVEAGAADHPTPLSMARLDVFPVSIPLSRPMKMAGVLVTSADNLFVRIETADGHVGWGEAASAPTMTGDTLPGLVAAARLLGEAMMGVDLRRRAAVSDRLERAMYGNQGAKSAVEMAILDLVGRAQNVSAVDLLGGRRRHSLAPMWLLGNATVDADVAEARERLATGFRFFKLKVGTKALADDIAAVRAVRDALGPDVKLCADANGGLDFAAAAELLRATQDAGLKFLEQPLPAGHLGDMARLQAGTRVPLGADEGIHGLDDIDRHAQAGAARGVSLKLIKLGGPTAMMKAAARAAELGLSINIAAKVAETSLASAAAAHVASAVESVDWGISLTQVYLEHDPVVRPLAIVGGAVAPPDGPGLGVEVDTAALQRYRTMV